MAEPLTFRGGTQADEKAEKEKRQAGREKKLAEKLARSGGIGGASALDRFGLK